jgi:hypothetical protein
MVSLFSTLLTRLTNGSPELYEVLGQLPGVRREDLVGDTHGGLVETSQLLALHPEWVERDYATLPRRTVNDWLIENGEEPPKIERGRPAGVREMVKAFRGALRYFRVESYAGTPAAASPELGRRILDRLAGEAAAVVVEILEGKLPPEQWHSPLWPKRFLFVNPFMVWLVNRLLQVSDRVY